jgi:hypothetical protein
MHSVRIGDAFSVVWTERASSARPVVASTSEHDVRRRGRSMKPKGWKKREKWYKQRIADLEATLKRELTPLDIVHQLHGWSVVAMSAREEIEELRKKVARNEV